MSIQLPANISRNELTEVLRHVPVTLDGRTTSLFEVGDEVRSGVLHLSATRNGRQATPQPAQQENVTVDRDGDEVHIHVHL